MRSSVLRTVLFYLFLLCPCTPCKDRAEKDITHKKRVPIEGATRLVPMDSLPVTAVINPIFGKLNTDNLVLFSPMNADGVLSIFSLPGMKFLYSDIRKGRGPGEFVAINWAHSLLENTVSVYDIPQALLRSYSVSRDTIVLSREYELRERMEGGPNVTMPYVAMLQLNESQFITRAAARDFDELKLQDLESGKAQSVVPDILQKDTKRDLYLSYNYVFGFGNDRLVRAYRYFDRVEIIRKNEDNTFTPEVVMADSKNYENNLDSEKRVVYYRDVVCGERDIYLLYSGAVDNVAVPSRIEVLDYEGNSVSSISLDRSVSTIMVDEVNRVIYGIAPLSPDYIYIYNM